MSKSNLWSRPSNPPPRLFTGQKEVDFVKQVNDELIERTLGQVVLYYPIDIERSNYHPIYGEAQNKVYLPPIRVNALIDWEGSKTEQSQFGVDRFQTITIHFHKRRLEADQLIYIQEGDVCAYDGAFFEIVELNDPQLVFGLADSKMEISAKCNRCREGFFDG